MTTPIAPLLRVERVHIRQHRSIRTLNLPEDGMGWNARIPDVTMVGGANGSGKTSLLRFIANSLEGLRQTMQMDLSPLQALEWTIDLQVCDGVQPSWELRLLGGDKPFVEAHLTENCCGFIRDAAGPEPVLRSQDAALERLVLHAESPERLLPSGYPRVVLFPSDNRDLVLPQVRYKAPGHLEDHAGFVVQWERSPEAQWEGSTLELLFSARWADLNAKENGHPEQAVNFLRYARSLGDLTGGEKRLGWTPKGDLVVELAAGGQHSVDALSSGERQVLLLLAELRRLWRPGSLILIDELELHLHDAWQARLYEVIVAMQRELGGQVILTTQSHTLFGLADSGTRVVLGNRPLR